MEQGALHQGDKAWGVLPGISGVIPHARGSADVMRKPMRIGHFMTVAMFTILCKNWDLIWQSESTWSSASTTYAKQLPKA
eukprot:scaffold1425_cov208-Pinguiococcus_pyrenoidosus.AAC.1